MTTLVACQHESNTSQTNPMNFIKRGNIWFSRLIGEGNMQNGLRPVIIVQNDVGNRYSNLVTIVPTTARVKKMMPTHVTISTSSGLERESIALCENIITIPKDNLISYIGKCNDLEMHQINRAMDIQLGRIKKNFDEIDERITRKAQSIIELEKWITQGDFENTNSILISLNYLIEELNKECEKYGRDIEMYYQSKLLNKQRRVMGVC